MNLLLLCENNPAEGDEVCIKGKRAEHIHCVLRAKPGDKIRCGIPGGNMGYAELLESDRKQARLRIGALDTPPPEPKNIRLIVALPRPQSFKKVLHFAASAGIGKVCFAGLERVEKSYWNSSAMEPGNIREEIVLGLEQGVNTIYPEIEFVKTFRELVQTGKLEEFSAGTRKFIAHPVNARDCPYAVKEAVTLAIGPEGGFVPAEVECFIEHGFEPVTFGPHILRVEFAVSYLTGRIAG